MNQISVVSEIDRVVHGHPECDAIESANGRISYRRFGEYVGDFVEQLESCTAPGEFIGIEAMRTAGSIVAMIGALKAGRPFVFIDPRDSASYRTKISLLGITMIANTPAVSDAPVLTATPTTWHDDDAADRSRQARAELAADHDRIGYAIHTSGSTGEPKCVLVRADPLARLIRDHVRRLALDTGCRTLQFARLTFDGCITEILWTLTSGACLVILGEEHLGPGAALQATLETFRITHLKTTPFALTATEPTDAMSLRHVINGGGACRPAVVRKWSPNTAFHNAYGTTETTVCNLLSDALDPDDCVESVPLGELVGEPGYRIVPLPAAEVAPAGPGTALGELVMTGECVALGYLTPAGLLPFVDEDGGRVYRTGDIVEVRDGRIVYVERLDRQLKIRGYRLDPGEIENAACRVSGVVEAVVTAESHEGADIPAPDDAPDDALVCYYQGVASPRAVRSHLEAVLDPYKVPSVIQQIEKVPYTRNGKVDRDALRTSRRARTGPGQVVTPAEQVLELVRGLTGVTDVSLDDNFFEIGGDSASTVLLVGKLRQLGWMDVGVRDVLRAENMKALVVQLPDQGV